MASLNILTKLPQIKASPKSKIKIFLLKIASKAKYFSSYFSSRIYELKEVLKKKKNPEMPDFTKFDTTVIAKGLAEVGVKETSRAGMSELTDFYSELELKLEQEKLMHSGVFKLDYDKLSERVRKILLEEYTLLIKPLEVKLETKLLCYVCKLKDEEPEWAGSGRRKPDWKWCGMFPTALNYNEVKEILRKSSKSTNEKINNRNYEECPYFKAVKEPAEYWRQVRMNHDSLQNEIEKLKAKL